MSNAGFFHFLAQSDVLAKSVLAILLLMSVASWSVILLKAYRVRLGARQREDCLATYRASPTPLALDLSLRRIPASGARGRLVSAGFSAWHRWHRRAEHALTEATSLDDFLDRALHRAVAAERGRQEHGLALLAAVASTAPFVGLFGTVWSIYHALLAIGVSGQTGLDKVAGPVGEALIMTAIGLAVAIPAALAYNGFVRATRLAMADLEDLAHEFHAFLATGVNATLDSAPMADARAEALAECV
jgi:biopolymer transport protein ExbB